MKNVIVFMLILGLNHRVLSQPVNSFTGKETVYETAMINNIKKMDTATGTTLIELINNFQRIARVEKAKWEPLYYAAYCYTVLAFISPDNSKIDGLTEEADKLVQAAIALDPDNSELSTLAAMIVSCRIMVDPMGRFPVLSREVTSLIAKAKEQNPDNPRIYLLEARMQLRTPEAFGGGKKIAKASIEKAINKFDSFISQNKLSPSWGYNQANTLLGKINSQ